MDILAAQKNTVKRMLESTNNEDSDVDSWKILIYDLKARSILSPLYNLKELRSLGVTLHLLIDAKKDPVRHVPAIYFIESSYKSLDLFLEDAKNDLYLEYHLNFISAVSPEMLNYVAKNSVLLGVSEKIKSVFDQFSNFHSIESQIFSLELKESFLKSIQKREPFIDSVVSGLFDVLSTLKKVPIIKAKSDSISEKIAKRLTEKIAIELQNKSNLFTQKSSFSSIFRRPVLLLVERKEDISVALHHAARYQPLVHDVLGLKNNRIVFDVEGESGKSCKMDFDLSLGDKFWEENKGDSFPNVAKSLDELIKDYKQKKDKIEARSSDSSQILTTVSELPKIRQQKQWADRHSCICGELSKKMRERKIADFFGVEENLMFKKTYKFEKIEELLKSLELRLEDKFRVFTIFLASLNSFDSKDAVRLESVLIDSIEGDEDKNRAKSALTRAKQIANPSSSPNPLDLFKPSSLSSARPSDQPLGNFTLSTPIGMLDLGRSKNLWGSLLDRGSQLFSEVKSILPSSQKLPLTKLVEEQMRGGPGSDEKMVTFDPRRPSGKLLGARKVAETGKFSEAIVFVVGGGNYGEFLGLKNLEKYREEDGGFNKILYGSTEILRPDEFLDVLTG